MPVIESVKDQEVGNPVSGTINERPAAPTIGDIMSIHGIRGGQSQEASEYIDRIKKAVQAFTTTEKVQVRRLGNDENITVFTVGKDSVILRTDSEVVSNLNELLVEADLQRVYKEFKAIYPENQLINIIACNKYMYGKASQMTTYIKELLHTRNSEFIKNFTVKSFTRKYKLEIDTDVTAVKQYLEMNSPNATRTVDFGFTASVVDNEQDSSGGYQKREPIFAVSGYVDFVEIAQSSGYIAGFSTGPSRFQPIIHVTDICSTIVSSKILALAIPLAAEIFVNRELWKTPFLTLGRTDINIGNLLLDPEKNTPYKAKTATDIARTFTNIEPPLFTVDVISGAAGLPGLNRFTNPDRHHLISQDIADFLDTDERGILPSDGKAVSYNVDREIVGIVESAKGLKGASLLDTRDISYLFATSLLGYSDKIRHLMRGSSDPIAKYELIKEIIGEVIPTGLNTIALINGDFITKIAVIISSKIDIVLPTNNTAQQIDISKYTDLTYNGVSTFSTSNNSNMNFQQGSYTSY